MIDIQVVLDRISPVPLYHQLARQIEAAIEDGRLAKGSYFDNEIDLATRWQVSRPTVRQAMQDLVERGLLVRRRGVGTQVVSAQARRSATLSSLHDDLRSQGMASSTIVVTHERVIADMTIAADLELAAGSPVVFIERCRSADGRRLAIMRNWLSVDAAGDLTTVQLARTGLYALMQARGVRPHSALQRIGARSASPTDAALLGIPVGSALLTMRRVMRDDSGTPIEVGEHIFDASNYSIEMTVFES